MNYDRRLVIKKPGRIKHRKACPGYTHKDLTGDRNLYVASEQIFFQPEPK